MNGSGASTLTIVGSGTLVPDGDRSSAAHFIEGPGFGVLMDCGAGTLHGMARFGLPWQALTHIAISHFHADHVTDLSPMLAALKHGVPGGRTEPLTLIGPPGFGDFLGRLGDVVGSHVADPGFPVVVAELEPGMRFEDGVAGFSLAAHPTPHTDESVAYRWEGPGGVVGYTGDTGPSKAVGHFLRDCDVLVAECTLTDPPATALHLSPGTVAELASQASPGVLVLTHVFPPFTAEEAARLVAASGYSGRVVAGRDGLTMTLQGVDPLGRRG